MNHKPRSLLLLARLSPGLLIVGLSLLLAGCEGFPQIGTGTSRPSAEQLQAALKWEDQYVYFPGYEIYYNRTQGYYVYWTNDGWVERFDLPAEVEPQELLASPFVEMPFHDSPGPHHAQVSRDYPLDWGQPNAQVAEKRQEQ